MPDDLSELPLMSPPGDVRSTPQAEVSSAPVGVGQLLVERYEVERELPSVGGMARFAAVDRVRRGPVIVSVVPTEALPTASDRESLVRRLEDLARLKSPQWLTPAAVHQTERAILWSTDPPPELTLADEMRERRARGVRYKPEEVQRTGISLTNVLSGLPPGAASRVTADQWHPIAGGWKLGGAADAAAADVLNHAASARGVDDAPPGEAALVRGVAAICYEMLCGTPPGDDFPAPHAVRGGIPLRLSSAVVGGLKGGARGGFSTLSGFRRALERAAVKQGNSWLRQWTPTVLIVAAIAVGGIVWYKNRPADESHLKPAFAEALGRVDVLRERLKGLDETIAKEADTAEKAVAVLEKDLAGAQDSNKPTQTAMLRGQLEQAQSRRERSAIVADAWLRHQLKPKWAADANGQYTRAKSFEADGQFADACAAMAAAEVNYQALLDWPATATQAVEQAEQQRKALAAARALLRDDPAELLAWPEKALSSAGLIERLVTSDGRESLDELTRVEQMLRNFEDLLLARRTAAGAAAGVQIAEAGADYDARLQQATTTLQQIDERVARGDFATAPADYRALAEACLGIPVEFIGARVRDARSLAEQGDRAAARPMLVALLPLDRLGNAVPAKVDQARLLLAELAAAEADHPTVVEWTNQVLARDASSAAAHALRGAALLALGDSRLAAADAAAWVAVEPQSPDAQLLRARIAVERESYDEALAAVAVVQAHDPGNAAARVVWSAAKLGKHEYRDLLADAPPTAGMPRAAELLAARSEAGRRLGDAAAAVDAARQALAIDAKCLAAHEALVAALLADGKADDARAAAEAALEAASDDNDAAQRLARAAVHALRGEFSRAEREADAAVRLSPKDHRAHARRAGYRYGLGNFDAAAADCDAALDLCEGSVEALSRRGAVYLLRKNYRAALDDWTAALAIVPRHDEVLVRRALLLACCPDGPLRDGNQAYADATAAFTAAPHPSSELLAALAAAYAECGDFAEAIARQQQAIELIDDPLAARAARHYLELYRQGKPRRFE